MLKLFKNNISDDGAHAIAKMLTTSSCVTELHLSHNQFTEVGAKTIIDAIAASEKCAGRDPHLAAWRGVKRGTAKRRSRCVGYDLIRAPEVPLPSWQEEGWQGALRGWHRRNCDSTRRHLQFDAGPELLSVLQTAFRAEDSLTLSVQFMQRQAGDPCPLWVRLEQNYIQNAPELYKYLTKKGVRF